MGKKLSQTKALPHQIFRSYYNEHLSFNEFIYMNKQKLNRVNGILAKLNYYVTADILRTIYYAFFDSHTVI